MSRKQTSPLPVRLRYLEPVLQSLRRLPPDQINEDLDVSQLERALRQRIAGLKAESIRAALDADRVSLEEWLKRDGRSNNPGYWILGVFCSPDLVHGLRRAPTPLPRSPEIHFDAPAGWKVSSVPSASALNLKKGKLLGVIQAFPKETLQRLISQREAGPKGFDLSRLPPNSPLVDQIKTLKSKTEVSDVCFGGSSMGKKFCYIQTAPAPWKRVDYYLTVSGGYVYVMLDGTGKDFDESIIENKFETIRVTH